MRDLPADLLALLRSGAVTRRLFFRLYNEGGPTCFWDGDHPLTLGGLNYAPVGEVPRVSAVQQVSNLSVPGFTVDVPALPGVDASFWREVFGNDADWYQKRVEVDVGVESKDTHAVHSRLIEWFRGFFDHVDVQEEAAGGGATLTCTFESTARELTDSSVSVRSDTDQRERDGSDKGFEWVSTAGEVDLTWGNKGPRDKKKRKGRDGDRGDGPGKDQPDRDRKNRRKDRKRGRL